MGVLKPRFMSVGMNNVLGLAGYLNKLLASLGLMGTATVISGQTAIVVTDANAQAGDLIFTSIQTKGANAAYVVGTSISAGVSFTITVNTDPGSGGCVIAFVRIPKLLLFTS